MNILILCFFFTAKPPVYILVSLFPHIHNKLIYKSAMHFSMKHSRNNITLKYVRFFQITFKHICHALITNILCCFYKIIGRLRIYSIRIWYIILIRNRLILLNRRKVSKLHKYKLFLST